VGGVAWLGGVAWRGCLAWCGVAWLPGVVWRGVAAWRGCVPTRLRAHTAACAWPRAQMGAGWNVLALIEAGCRLKPTDL